MWDRLSPYTIVWDVGHQTHVYELLRGRTEKEMVTRDALGIAGGNVLIP